MREAYSGNDQPVALISRRLFLKISLLCGEKYYTDLFLEENPAGLIQPPIIQTS